MCLEFSGRTTYKCFTRVGPINGESSSNGLFGKYRVGSVMGGVSIGDKTEDSSI